MQTLGNTLFNTTQQRVLALLYGQPDRSFYTKEILRLTGMGVFTIKRELDRMTETGILTLQRIGNQHHYQANPACPIYGELRGIVLKTFGMADVIKAGLEVIDRQITLAFVFGSIAKASDSSASDIDLLLVGEKLSYGGIVELLQPAEQTLSRTINPTIYTELEFGSKLKSNSKKFQKKSRTAKM